MLRPHSPLFNAATETPIAGAGGEPKATIGQTIKAALASKADLQAKLELAQTDLAARDATITTLQADLTTAQARVATLEAEAADISAALTAHQAEVTTLKAAEQDLNARADAKAKEKMASLGFPSANLPAPDEKIDANATDADVMAEYAKITDPKAAADFYAARIATRIPR